MAQIIDAVSSFIKDHTLPADRVAGVQVVEAELGHVSQTVNFFSLSVRNCRAFLSRMTLRCALIAASAARGSCRRAAGQWGGVAASNGGASGGASRILVEENAMNQSVGLRKAVIAAGLAAMGVTANAQVNMFDGNWHFSVSPYAWLPTINMSATIHGPIGTERDPAVSVDPGSYLSSLDMAFMITAEARKGDWSIFTDWVYNDFGKSDSHVRSVSGPAGRIDTIADTGSRASVKNNIWTTAGSYTAWRNGASHLDVLAGFRYLAMDTGLDYNFTILTNAGPLARGGNVSESKDFWDFIAGVKGDISLSEDGKWFMPYYVDIGTGTSGNWTWQALVGAGYRFNWGAVTLSLRNISYNFDKDDGNMRLTGGAIGLTFPF